MNLPRDIARCRGRMSDPLQLDCLDCARRQAGLVDYMAGEFVTWMEPPKEDPCPERLEPKK